MSEYVSGRGGAASRSREEAHSGENDAFKKDQKQKLGQERDTMMKEISQSMLLNDRTCASCSSRGRPPFTRSTALLICAT